MMSGLLILLSAQAAAAYGPALPAAPAKPAPPPAAAPQPCPPPSAPDPKTGVITVCAQRPQGYRLNPDIVEAKREVRSAGRPTRPGPMAMKDDSCTVVGPAPCMEFGINLLAAAVTAATMAERLSKGEEIGSMFVTDPHPDEYHLYLDAKARREAREAEKAAKAKAASVTAAPAPTPAPAATQQPAATPPAPASN